MVREWVGRTGAEVHSDGDDAAWVDRWFGRRAHGDGAIAHAEAEVHVLTEARIV